MGVKVRGLEAAKRRLQRVADRVAGVTHDAIVDFGVQATHYMKNQTPIDTGKLWSSIEMRETNTGITIGPRGVDYAEFVENGTSRTPAQPYIAPTIEWARINGPKRVARWIEGEITK